MKQGLVQFLGITTAILLATPAIAAEEWVQVTVNSVGDRFMVDKNSLQRKGNAVWFWEYRSFPQPNNAFLEEKVDQPVYGVVLHRSVDCRTKIDRLRRITAYNQKKQVIRRFNYEAVEQLSKPTAGSSAEAVLNFVCGMDAQSNGSNR